MPRFCGVNYIFGTSYLDIYLMLPENLGRYSSPEEHRQLPRPSKYRRRPDRGVQSNASSPDSELRGAQHHRRLRHALTEETGGRPARMHAARAVAWVSTIAPAQVATNRSKRRSALRFFSPSDIFSPAAHHILVLHEKRNGPAASKNPSNTRRFAKPSRAYPRD